MKLSVSCRSTLAIGAQQLKKNQEDNRRSQNAFEKGALKRIADKEAIRQDLMRKKGIEHIKKMEETRLHTVDIE